MRHIYKYLMIIAIIVSIIIYTFASIKDVATQTISPIINENIIGSNIESVTLREEELKVTEITATNSKYPLNKVYKVSDEQSNLFSLSYITNNLQLGSILKLKNDNLDISDQIYYILKESYPNVSLQEMGVDSQEEAYQVQQLAIWEVAYRTKEAKYGSELSRIESIELDLGKKYADFKIFNKAKQLRDRAFQYSKVPTDYQEKPKLSVYGEQAQLSNFIINGKKNYLVGPIKYTLSGGTVNNSNITISSELLGVLNGRIVDSNGMNMENIQPNTDFYIAFSKYPPKAITITVNTNCKYFKPSIYTYNDADYIANTYIDEDVSNSITVET